MGVTAKLRARGSRAMFGAIFSIILFVGASGSASAVIFDLADHSDGAKTPPFEYGLRLDDEGKFFSFDGISTARLSVDTTSVAASISGTVIENSATDDAVAAWTLSYVFSGITLVGTDGEFTATGGTGTLMEIGGSLDIINLVGKQKAFTGIAFSFLNDGFRLPVNSGFVGRGWIDKPGTNDFLLTATVVPLPPAALLFGSALAGMGFLSRRRKSASKIA